MVQTVRFHEPGGPDALRVEDLELPPPGPGEVQIRHLAIGINFVDIYQRTGLYPVPALPSGLGVEGAGVVEAVGPDVSDLRSGDRVVYGGLPVGSYAEARNLPAWRLVPLADGLDPVAMAALFSVASRPSCSSSRSGRCTRARCCWCTPRPVVWA